MCAGGPHTQACACARACRHTCARIEDFSPLGACRSATIRSRHLCLDGSPYFLALLSGPGTSAWEPGPELGLQALSGSHFPTDSQPPPALWGLSASTAGPRQCPVRGMSTSTLFATDSRALRPELRRRTWTVAWTIAHCLVAPACSGTIPAAYPHSNRPQHLEKASHVRTALSL